MNHVLIAFALSLQLATSRKVVPLAAIDSQLATLHADTALVYPSQGIDEYPLWSPDCRFIAVDAEGKWEKVDLNQTQLASGAWRGGQILGVIQNASAVSSASAEEIAAWQKMNKLRVRKATVGQTRVELREHELSTELVITRHGQKPEVRWSSDEENCHSLVTAPDKQHVAFICELNGLFILRIGN